MSSQPAPKVVATPAVAAQGATPAATLSLSQVAIGQQVLLAAVGGPRTLQHRLAEMGLRLGVRFTLLNRGSSGPFIISLKDSRLVLGHAMGQYVQVYPCL